MNWVSIKERLPAFGEPVLTCDNEGTVVTAELESTDKKGAHWLIAHTDDEWEDVTYWAPLPAAPQGYDGNGSPVPA